MARVCMKRPGALDARTVSLMSPLPKFGKVSMSNKLNCWPLKMLARRSSNVLSVTFNGRTK